MEELKQLGLNDNEIKVYVTMLKIGLSTASTISEKTGLYRPYVYDTLEKLIDKGLVSYVIKDNKKHFQADHPKKLIENLKEKEENIKKILPTLISFTKLPREETKVEIFKGKQIIKIVFKDIIRELSGTKGENLVLGVSEKRYTKQDPIVFKQFLNKLEKFNIKEKVIIKQGDKFMPGGKNTTYKWLEEEYFSPATVNTYGNKTAITVWGTPNHMIMIDSKQIAESYRKQFYALWKLAKSVKKKS